MCLAVPSRIVQVDDHVATIDVEGIRREASLLLLEDAVVGDYVIVHAGFAIHRIDEEEAQKTLNLLRKAAGSMPPEE